MQNWSKLNAQGFIPGENESEINFYKRVDYCVHLSEHLAHQTIKQPLLSGGYETNNQLLKDVLPFTEEYYGIRPEWVMIFCTNYHLAPWHGGCAWIFQLDEHSPVSAFLQLRASFQNTPTYLWIYHRQELIAHELSHIGRMMYQEPKFEEFFAYQSSYSTWRRLFGPIIQSSMESALFIVVLMVVIIIDWLFLFMDYQNISHLSIILWCRMIPLGLVVGALMRLLYHHYILKKCLIKLTQLVGEKKKASHLLYRLTDREIKTFSNMALSDIRIFVNKVSAESFRWRFLQDNYCI